MVKTFIKMIGGFFEYLAQEAINLVLSFFAWMGSLGVVVLDMPVIKTGILYTQIVALTVLGIKVSYESMMIYILRQQGEPSSDPTQLLIGTIRAVGVISVMPWLVRFIFNFGLTVASEVSKLPGTGFENADNSTFTVLMNLLISAGNALLFIAIGIVFGIILLIIVIIQTFIRSIELASTALMGSFMALGLTNKQSESWASWMKDILTISFTGAMQIGLLKVSFFTLLPIQLPINGQMVTAPAMINLLLFLAALWVTYKTPNSFKDKIYSTGIGRAGGGVAQSVGQSFVMRMVLRRR